MTIRRKLQISNILMLVIPVVVMAAAGLLCFKLKDNHYFDAVEDILEYDGGAYYAQSLCFSYWQDFEENPDKAAADLQVDLAAMGFHLWVSRDGEERYSNLAEEEEERAEQLLEKRDTAVKGMILSEGDADLILNQEELDGVPWTMMAIRLNGPESSSTGRTGSVNRLLVIFLILALAAIGAILLTNAILAFCVSRSILTPMKRLQEGANRIEEGDLDFDFGEIPQDEIGEVCRDFDRMRLRLKEATRARLEYENYRRELLAGISHDLRTPLTSIKGYADGLLEGIADTEEKRQRYYRAIRTRAGDMEALADSLSSFSRLENRKLNLSAQPCRLSDFLGDLLEGYAVEAEKKGILFINDVPRDEVWLRLDEAEMKRVFINLFENSAKYRSRSQSVIHLSRRCDGTMVEIRVADDGPGVPEEDLEHIFNSFYRGDRSRTNPAGGSGLGLAVARQIVEGHGGTIRAENDRGLTVILCLPQADGTEEKER